MPTNARQPGRLSSSVAAEIRAQLGRRGWKQIDLSRASGIHRATLSALLKGTSTIDLEQLAKIADAFSLHPDDLIRSALDHADADNPGSSSPDDSETESPAVTFDDGRVRSSTRQRTPTPAEQAIADQQVRDYRRIHNVSDATGHPGRGQG